MEVPDEDDIDHHDSQMVSQEISIDDDPDENTHGMVDYKGQSLRRLFITLFWIE